MKNTKKLKLIGYYDSDWGGCIDHAKSNSGYSFYFENRIFSWSSKKQQSAAQSRTKAEHALGGLATSQALWRILEDVLEKQEGTELFCDNKSTITMAKNPTYYSRTRHNVIRHQFYKRRH